jgi:hypothetical protein
MSARDIQFDGAFHALTDHFPFGWQRRLFDRLRSGRDVPRLCYLPTGLGKTSVIPIWLIALAHQAQQDSLIVHDEAHLTPSFSEVLHQVAEAQRQACEPRPMRAIELSATSRGAVRDRHATRSSFRAHVSAAPLKRAAHTGHRRDADSLH